jgi:hypothetical protein
LPDQEKRQNDKGNQGAPPPRKPVIVRLLRTLKRHYHRYAAEAEKKRSDHERNEWLMAKWTRQVGVFTIILSFIAGLSAAISFLQWQTLEKSDETLRKTVEATQRPWLKIIEASMKNEVTFATDKPTEIAVNIKLKNFGNGVASHVEGNSRLVAIKKEGIPYISRLQYKVILRE